MKSGGIMNLENKGYILTDNKIIPLEIENELLEEYFIKNNFNINQNNIEKYSDFEYHYQYLEFYCNYFGLEYDKTRKDNLVLYANYLDYILSSNGYIIITIIKPEGKLYNKNNLPLVSKKKVQTKPQTIMVVPDNVDLISDGQKKSLKHIRKILQCHTQLDVYSYKDEEAVYNGCYTKYDVDKYFDKIIENKNKKLKFRIFR